MIYHLHNHDTEHKLSCRYCNYQQIRRARQMRIEKPYNENIKINHSKISDEINQVIVNNIDLNNPVLITHIATNTLQIIEPILENLDRMNNNFHLIKNLMEKTVNRNFGENRDISCEEKFNWISLNQGQLPNNILEYHRIIFVDDVYDTGCSYEIAKAKLVEIGVDENRIDLITILRI